MHRLLCSICGPGWGAAVALALVAGCSPGGGDTVVTTTPDSGTGASADVQPTSGPYQPLSVGATWSYHVNDKGVKYDKNAAFEVQEDLGGPKAGTTAFRMKETFPATVQLTWYHQEGDVVVRDHEQALDVSN